MPRRAFVFAAYDHLNVLTNFLLSRGCSEGLDAFRFFFKYNQSISCLRFFPLSTQVSPVSHRASTTLVRFLALLRLSSALPDPVLVPATLRSFVRFHLLSRFRSRSIPAPDPAAISDPAPNPVRAFPYLGTCACTGTRPCERSCRVPASTTLCL